MKRFTTTPELKVRALSTRSTVYDGPAYSLSAANQVGPLDILPGHANLLTILSDCTVRIDTEAELKEFAVTKGLVKVVDNSVTLFINL